MTLPSRILAFWLLAACRTPALPAPTPTEGPGAALLEAKRRQGVDVFAVGHEPEWSLDIDEQGDLRFRPLEGDSLRAALSSFRKSRKSRMILYELRRDDNRLRVTLSKQPCKDNMSGRNFPLTAVVEWHGPDTAVRTLNGCAIRIR